MSIIFSSKIYLSIYNYVSFGLSFRKQYGIRVQKESNRLHKTSDIRIRERISLQPLPNAEKTNRNRSHTVSLGTTNQNLVPEQKNEMEKGTQTSQHKNKTYGSRNRAFRSDSSFYSYVGTSGFNSDLVKFVFKVISSKETL